MRPRWSHAPRSALTRRSLLRLGALVAVAPALTACAGAQAERAVERYLNGQDLVTSFSTDARPNWGKTPVVRAHATLRDGAAVDEVLALCLSAQEELSSVFGEIDLSLAWAFADGGRCEVTDLEMGKGRELKTEELLRECLECTQYAATTLRRTAVCHRPSPVGSSLTVDWGQVDAVPADVLMTTPAQLAPSALDLAFTQTMVLGGWPVLVSPIVGESMESAPLAEIVGVLGERPDDPGTLATASPSDENRSSVRVEWSAPSGLHQVTADMTISVRYNDGMDPGPLSGSGSTFDDRAAEVIRVVDRSRWRHLLSLAHDGAQAYHSTSIDASVRPLRPDPEMTDAEDLSMAERLLDAAS
ncbi:MULTISPECIES: hypothetical protein [Actinomyces]|uniref:Tat pathway signal protein n=1 Tax=Actinomyces respiraculi TaxID=2744574 RepID=A0A7T0PWD9_9ACTO|nr:MULTISPECIES: hypothetical protein [Actinomyces]QPL05378.1 hypothetical protein ID810_11885 [Actinomyces respiraculi]